MSILALFIITMSQLNRWGSGIIPEQVMDAVVSPYWRHFASMSLLLVWIRIMTYMLKYKVSAVFVLIIVNMITGTGVFMVVLTVFLLAFASSFFILLNGHKGYQSLIGTVMTMFRAFMGDFDYDVISDKGGFVGQVFFVIFCTVVTTLLLNLLIAVMATAYNDAEEQAIGLQFSLRCKAIVREFTVLGANKTNKIFTDIFSFKWDLSVPFEIDVMDEEVEEDSDSDSDSDEDDVGPKAEKKRVLEEIIRYSEGITGSELSINESFQTLPDETREKYTTMNDNVASLQKNFTSVFTDLRELEKLYKEMSSIVESKRSALSK